MTNFENEMKLLSKNDRLIEGNKNTDYVKKYISNRFKENLHSAPLILDIFGIDFLSLKDNTQNHIKSINEIKTSFQGKVRVSKWGMHFIYEACIIKPTDKQYTSFKITPGRDARGLSDWYVCLTCTRANIKFVKTQIVKEKINHYLSKFFSDMNYKFEDYNIVDWAKETKKGTSTMYDEAKSFDLDLNNVQCKLPVFSKEKIYDYWVQAANRYNKYIVLANYDDDKLFDEEINEYVLNNSESYSKDAAYYASRGVEIQFKIDEGYNKYSNIIGKILVYIPYVFFNNENENTKYNKKLNYFDGEVWNNSSTWIKK